MVLALVPAVLVLGLVLVLCGVALRCGMCVEVMYCVLGYVVCDDTLKVLTHVLSPRCNHSTLELHLRILIKGATPNTHTRRLKVTQRGVVWRCKYSSPFPREMAYLKRGSSNCCPKSLCLDPQPLMLGFMSMKQPSEGPKMPFSFLEKVPFSFFFFLGTIS